MEEKPLSRAHQGALPNVAKQTRRCGASPQPPSVAGETAVATESTARADLLARAVALHAEYIESVIEAGDFCPWARGARVASRSRVHALWFDALPDFIRAIPDDDALEVWQLVVPDAPASPMQWRDHVATLERALRKEGAHLPWAFAAFHPTHPGRPESIGGAIGLLRRSPVPALQLVHLDVLDRVRRHSEEFVESLAALNRQRLLTPDDRSLAETHGRLLKAGERLLNDCGPLQ